MGVIWCRITLQQQQQQSGTFIKITGLLSTKCINHTQPAPFECNKTYATHDKHLLGEPVLYTAVK